MKEIQDPELIKEFEEIEKETLKCNEIKYAAYRTASKLRIWQKELHFDEVSLNVVRNIFNCHRILVTDAKVIVTPDELDALLNDILFAACRLSLQSFNIDTTVDLTKTFLNRVFKSNEGISVLDLKVGLVCLCAAPLNEKYCYLFSQLSDHNLCLSRKRLKRLLESVIHLPCFLGESNSFNNSYIGSTLDSCFSAGTELGVSEADFLCWLLQEPQLLIWLSTLYRVQASENVSHNVRCAVCTTKPINGLRYICLRCINYDLCQNCFFTGKKSKRHRANHEIREYYSKASPCETLMLYVKGIMGRVFGQSARLQYLPAVSSDLILGQTAVSADYLSESCLWKQKFDDTTVIHKPDEQLNAIIERIEKETKDLVRAAKSSAAPEIIEKHSSFLNEQLHCLKSMKKQLQKSEDAIFMSTPIVPIASTNENKLLRTPLLLNDESSWTLPSPSGFSTWQNTKMCNGETSYSMKLQQDLDMIMLKLNGLIEQTNEESCEESTTAFN